MDIILNKVESALQESYSAPVIKKNSLHEKLLEVEQLVYKARMDALDAFIDGSIEKWNELWPETFWAKRIDEIKTLINEENKK